MDVHELTAGYALDALDPAERAAFEEHLSSCERCRAELQGFWQVSGALAHAAGGPMPSASLRERILEQARSERPELGNVVPLRRRYAVPALSSVAAVAAVVAIGLGLWATSLSQELDDVRGDAEAVAVLSDPGRQELKLTGAEGRLVVSATGRAAIVISGVERAPEGKVYEIWVIEGGKPKPAGLFDGAGTRTVVTLSRPVPDEAIVAVTLERDGGVALPTGTPLITSPAV
jgi:anti-sigma-K factor RskA